MKKININQKFNLFNDHWNPKIVAELNGQNVKLAKVKGEFVGIIMKIRMSYFLSIKEL